MVSKEKNLCRIFCLCGVAGLVFYILHDVIGGMNYPGYQWMRQAVSDLTATDAPSYTIAGGFSHVYGIMSVVCCLFVCVLTQQRHRLTRLGVTLFVVMEFVSAVGYSLFPLSGAGYDGSAQSFIHVYIITTAVVLLSIVSLVLIAIGSFKDRRKALGICSIIALVLMFIGAVGSGLVPAEYFGVVERFSTYSAVVFCAVLGLFCFTEKQDV